MSNVPSLSILPMCCSALTPCELAILIYCRGDNQKHLETTKVNHEISCNGERSVEFEPTAVLVRDNCHLYW
jgi:hypothetical protein